jgi:hypothetical protein
MQVFLRFYFYILILPLYTITWYRDADKSLARPGKKQACQGRAISTTSRRELSSFFFLQGRAPKEIHAILPETLACFLPGRAKDLSAPL